MAEGRGTAFAAHAALVALLGAGLWALAAAQKLSVGWLFLLPAALSLGVRLPRGAPRLRELVGMAFRIVLLLSLAFGLAWTLYPVLPQAVFDAGPRVLGLALAAFAALFLLWASAVAPGHGAIPASLALLAVALLAPAGPPPLLPAGLATLALAVHGALDAPTRRPAGVPSGTASRLLRTGALCVGGAALAFGLVRLLPWAQPFVERASASWIDANPAGARSAVGNDSARLGAFDSLALSRRVVMRVYASQPQKLRVRVLTRFDGRGWQAERAAPPRLLVAQPVPLFDDVPGGLFAVPGASAAEAGAPALRSRVVLAQPDAAALAAPRGTRLVQLTGGTGVDAFGLIAAPQPAVEIYGLVNRRDVRDDTLPDRAALLALPAGTDPRFAELAARLASGADPRLRIQRTLNHLDRECVYALLIGPFRSEQPVAEFLFEKKRGYCVYFASAAAVLLRLQGIPTRLVTGWNVTGEDVVAGHFVVRESDAHAWIEAYLEDAGWVELDPTPAAQYAAVHGREDGWLSRTLEALAAVARELWVRLRAGDAASLGRWLLGRLAPAAVLAALWLLWRSLRRRRPRPATPGAGEALPEDVRGVIADLDAAFARCGRPRPPACGLVEHADALGPGEPTPERHAAIAEAAAFVYARAFGGAPADPDAATGLRRRLTA